ncbi:NAD-dependent epimerase/dehydratase family protein [Nafulsella turpanensis]|uniref:NAD-dependent epimerase/dehydratase family protein n=1 Tax=Nafulsella turpanensis TaxID=1265690 RepID=UPI00034C290F|nr:NAD-dependent epimerase/dehydratase family protein [Nafulsella turpanensis]
MENKKALIAGATGLVGQQLLSLLLSSSEYEKVYVLTRRTLSLDSPKVEEILLDFDELDESYYLPEVDDVFCCLGTTMKKAGSKAAFRKVDYQYPLQLAKKTASKGARQFLLVTAMGANRKSFFFYNKVKGEVEEDISKVSELHSISFFRPSLLLGERQENRTGEGIAAKLMVFLQPLMKGFLRKYRPIYARTVANGMLSIARQEPRGVNVYESEEIKNLSGEITVSQKM